jgi:hypothetical protein
MTTDRIELQLWADVRQQWLVIVTLEAEDECVWFIEDFYRIDPRGVYRACNTTTGQVIYE